MFFDHLRKDWAWRVCTCECHSFHLPILDTFWSSQAFVRGHRTDLSLIHSGTGHRGLCKWRRLRSTQTLVALFCRQACQSGCSNRSLCWIDQPRRRHCPSTAMQGRCYPLILGVKSNQRMDLTGFVSTFQRRRRDSNVSYQCWSFSWYTLWIPWSSRVQNPRGWNLSPGSSGSVLHRGRRDIFHCRVCPRLIRSSVH